MAAFFAFIVSGFLNESANQGTETLDSFLTLVFLAYIWYALQRQFTKKRPPHSTTPDPEKSTSEHCSSKKCAPDSSNEPSLTEDFFKTEQKAKPIIRQHKKHTVIHHNPPWSIVEQGASMGRYQNTPIFAWIRTSDDRSADYSGITELPDLGDTVSIEIPERSEIILPPGLVYTIRPS